MAKHPIAGAISWLAEQHKFVHKDGRVNCSAFGRHSDLPATTIMRLLKADDSWTPRVNTVRRISRAFGVAESQLLGFAAMTAGGLLPQAEEENSSPGASSGPLTEFERLFISRLRGLTHIDQIEALHFVEFKSQYFQRHELG